MLDVKRMIETARSQVAQATNAALTGLYWRIRQNVLKNRRAEGVRRGHSSYQEDLGIISPPGARGAGRLHAPGGSWWRLDRPRPGKNSVPTFPVVVELEDRL